MNGGDKLALTALAMAQPFLLNMIHDVYFQNECYLFQILGGNPCIHILEQWKSVT
jgi:hypothetical protein